MEFKWGKKHVAVKVRPAMKYSILRAQLPTWKAVSQLKGLQLSYISIYWILYFNTAEQIEELIKPNKEK